MPAVKNIAELIIRDTEARGGGAVLAGTGITVARIAHWSRRGLTPEEIADRCGQLDLAQVYAALAYHHATRGESEAGTAEERCDLRALIQEWMATPDDRGEAWWDEFQRDLTTHRPSFARLE